MSPKLKVIFYWNASCGGCEVALLDIHEKLLEVAAIADIVFSPVMMDAKLSDVQAMEDGSVDVAFLNGAVRNHENAEMIRLIRQKARVVVSFGACANWGGIPALANLSSREELLERVYDTSESTVNPDGTRPRWEAASGQPSEPAGAPTVPEMYRSVYAIPSLVEVDYLVPGCPPPAAVVWDFIAQLTSDNPPEPGIFPNLPSTVCKTCSREKRDVRPTRFYRPHEIEPEPDWCLMEQGILCLGAATRDGCEAICPQAGMPCRGCFGPSADALDSGAEFIAAVASLVDSEDLDDIAERLAPVADIAGTAYRFTLAASILGRRQVAEAKEQESVSYSREVAGG